MLPIPLHTDGVIELLGHGWHVNLQKPMCNDLADAQRMLDAATANGRVLRVMENYLFYEPLRKLKATVEAGEIGDVVGYHLKMVASGRGGWDVPMSSYEWQFLQMRNGRGILVFDDGWHKLATALWLFGPIAEVRAWIGTTEVVPGVGMDAPTTITWEHTNGIRGVWDITLATDLYLRSDYYTNDERWEVTGRARLRARQPVHRTAASSSRASRSTPTASSARSTRSTTTGPAASATPGVIGCDGCTPAEGPLWWSGEDAVDVLRFALAAYASSEQGGIGVAPSSVG